MDKKDVVHIHNEILLSHAAAAKSLQSCLILQPHGLQSAMLLCPWDSLGKNSGVGLPCPPPEGLPDPGVEPSISCGSCVASRFFTTEPLGKPYIHTSVQSLSRV